MVNVKRLVSSCAISPDDANHDWEGIFIAAGQEFTETIGTDERDRTTVMNILDVEPLIRSGLQRI